jgi:hypothetical protein
MEYQNSYETCKAGSRIAGEVEELCEWNEIWKFIESSFKISTQGKRFNRTCDELMEGRPKTVIKLKAEYFSG